MRQAGIHTPNLTCTVTANDFQTHKGKSCNDKYFPLISIQIIILADIHLSKWHHKEYSTWKWVRYNCYMFQLTLCVLNAYLWLCKLYIYKQPWHIKMTISTHVVYEDYTHTSKCKTVHNYNNNINNINKRWFAFLNMVVITHSWYHNA